MWLSSILCGPLLDNDSYFPFRSSAHGAGNTYQRGEQRAAQPVLCESRGTRKYSSSCSTVRPPRGGLLPLFHCLLSPQPSLHRGENQMNLNGCHPDFPTSCQPSSVSRTQPATGHTRTLPVSLPLPMLLVALQLPLTYCRRPPGTLLGELPDLQCN